MNTAGLIADLAHMAGRHGGRNGPVRLERHLPLPQLRRRKTDASTPRHPAYRPTNECVFLRKRSYINVLAVPSCV
jgi:hypothetical protein